MKRFLWLLCLCLGMAGCTKSYREQVESAHQAASETSAKRENAKLPVQAVLKGVESSLRGADGELLWTVNAQGAVIGDTQGNGVGSLKNGSATMYEQGKAKAIMRADMLTADKEGQFVTGQGNVSAKSVLVNAPKKSLRADTMRWDIKKKILTGRGNVVLTQDPDIVLRADAFRADLELRVIDLESTSGKVGTSF